MTGLIGLTQYQAEALIICLAASLVWAGLLLFGARSLERASPMSSAERIWIAALLFTVLPSLAAPTLAAFGISIRPAPALVEFEALAPAISPVERATEFTAVEKNVALSSAQIVSAGALFYVYGVFLAFFLWAARQAALQYAVARAEPATDGRLLEMVEGWANRLAVRIPQIRRSGHVSSVCISGLVRQTILIPRDIGARVSTEDLALMCAHELAHIRRGDTRLFTATQLSRVLFWFNPLVARIAAHVELAAEERADALVIQAGVDRRTYAACFVEGLKFAAYKMNAQPALAPSFTPPDRYGRRRRLNSILSLEMPRKAPLSKRLLLSAAASTMTLAAFGQAALAVDPNSASSQRSVLRALPLFGDVTLGYEEKIPDKLDADRPAHQGLDIKAAKGAKIFSPGDGVVLEATDLYNRSPAWGKVVVIDHGHGLITRYAHLDSYAVSKGDRVKAGEVIAAVGATGKTTGPHLHFETLQDGKPVDPATIVEESRIPVAPAFPAPGASPQSIPAPAARPSHRVEAPAPLFEIADVPGIREFAPSKALQASDFTKPFVVAGEPMRSEPEALIPESGRDIAGDFTGDLMFDDMETRLLGALDGAIAGSYNLTFRNDDKVYRFSSAEPMTSEERAEMRAALQQARKQMETARAEAAKKQKEFYREATRAKIDAEHEARLAAEKDRRLNAEEVARIRRQAQLTRREHLEIERQALEQARDGLETDIETDIEDAFADLDDAEADIQDVELSQAETAAALASIREQRRQLALDIDNHRRAIEQARRQLNEQIGEVDRELEKLDDARSTD